MNGLAVLTGLELRAMVARRALWAGAALAGSAAALGAIAGLFADAGNTSQVVNGWRCLAYGMGPGILFAALSAVLLGSQSVAAEAADGALRSLLMRPVTRPAVILAKALGLVVAAALLTAAAYGGAVLVGAAGAGFGDVVQYWNGEPLPGGTPAGVMWQRSLLLALVTPLTILAAAWLGLLTSVCTEQGGVAATAALFLAMPLALLSFGPWQWCRWIFPWPLRDAWQQFSLSAGQFSTQNWLHAPVGTAAWLPALSAALCLAAALAWFQRRDVLA